MHCFVVLSAVRNLGHYRVCLRTATAPQPGDWHAERISYLLGNIMWRHPQARLIVAHHCSGHTQFPGKPFLGVAERLPRYLQPIAAKSHLTASLTALYHSL